MPSSSPRLLTLAAILSLAAGCRETVHDAEDIHAPMGDPIPSASMEQLETFDRGEAMATRRLRPEDGLGPHFNVNFCGACHEKPVFGGSGARYRDFLIVRQELPDGSSIDLGVNGVQPQYNVDEPLRFPTDPGVNLAAERNPIPFFGVGLLAELYSSSILANEDEDDRDGDGISGRANYDRGFVGRFGRKAQTTTIEGFIRGPLFNHLGITSNPLSQALKEALPVPSPAIGGVAAPLTAELGVGAVMAAQAAAPEEPTTDNDGVPDPELAEQDLFDLVSWAMLLAAPEPDPPTEETEAGALLFEETGCADCHVRALRGPRGNVPAYSDLLLHDMGDELADGLTMGLASEREFRTQPLWGLSAVGPYLHDGRADTIDAAIRWHGGEAETAELAYEALPEADRTLLIAFLESLGGADQRTEGLLPPASPVPAAGEYGGPAAPLDATDLATYERGRALFDRDIPLDEGLGPLFNGDSCRACHFDPVIGGSGPADVDVIRHGVWNAMTLTVDDAAIGTMAHRHSVGPERPPFDAAADVIEARQTPPIFGLGLIEQIPEVDITSQTDPDGMGPIEIHVPMLPGPVLGRLGWKANVATVRDFGRDALFNETGMTSGTGDAFATDADVYPDPEFSDEDLDALVFFMEQLGPPPRSSVDAVAEAAGEIHFATIGCDDCHRPSFTLPDMSVVSLYSDLLLHDVSEPGQLGVTGGDANHLEYRTPPLWGLARTAPYMHDGRAFTVEEAIARHGMTTEARVSVDNYLMMLNDTEKAELIAFLESL